MNTSGALGNWAVGKLDYRTPVRIAARRVDRAAKYGCRVRRCGGRADGQGRIPIRSVSMASAGCHKTSRMLTLSGPISVARVSGMHPREPLARNFEPGHTSGGLLRSGHLDHDPGLTSNTGVEGLSLESERDGTEQVGTRGIHGCCAPDTVRPDRSGRLLDYCWMGLARIARDNVYTIVLRDKSCLNGPLKGVTPDSLAVDVSPILPSRTPQIVKVDRPEVLQVREAFAPTDILYSGRSSWADVQAVSEAVRSRESFHITLKSGVSVTGKPTTASDSLLSLDGKRSKAIAKADIARIAYIRIKPIAGGSVWFAQEAGWLALFDPHQWPYLFNVGVHMSVLLYDAAMVEDDSYLGCPQR